jgi:putative ABC transport system permease protein
MRAILIKIRRDIQRRRMQTAMVALITLLASAMATISLTLLVRSTAPYEEAFERVSGAHLLMNFDAAKVGPDELRATGALPVVTAAGEPHPIAYVPVEANNHKTTFELVGRDDPGGKVDRIQLAAGRWVQGPGEIVVTRVTTADAGQVKLRVGDTVYALGRSDRPAFRVVGVAIDLIPGSPERAWIRSDQVAGLSDATTSPLGYEMAYRVRDSSTDDGLQRDGRAIEDALPAGAERVPMISWLDAESGATWVVYLLSSILIAFTAFALIASALIVANSVIGAVVASQREIGTMKAVGFTPREVVLVFVGQMVAAAAVGSLFGVALGIAASQPLLDQSAAAVSLPAGSAFYPPADLGVLAGVLLLVAVAALVPALGAGSTSAVRALAVGLTPPSAGRGWLGRLLQRLRLPRPVTVGVDDAFRRPLRGLLTVSALLVGVATLTLAVGFRFAAETAVADPSMIGTNYDVNVERYSPYPDQRLMGTLSGHPDTSELIAVAAPTVRLAGLKDPLMGTAIRGDATRLGYHTYQGRWYRGAGEAIVAPVTMKEAHLKLGDVVEASIEGHPTKLRIVGQYNDLTVYDGRGMRFDWRTYTAVVPDAQPSSYRIRLRSGADARAFAATVQRSEPHFTSTTAVVKADDPTIHLYTAIMGVPALLLIVIAMVGVFNTMLLNSRERSFDIAVLKAVGMSGRQVVTMVVAPATLFGLIGAAVGAPAGIQLTQVLVHSTADSVGLVVDLGHAFGVANLGLIAVAGVATAVIGSLLPARWAARAPVAVVLRAE